MHFHIHCYFIFSVWRSFDFDKKEEKKEKKTKGRRAVNYTPKMPCPEATVNVVDKKKEERKSYGGCHQ